MNTHLINRAIMIFLVLSLGLTGYVITNGWAYDAPAYDLFIDNTPVNFSDERTMYLNTQTNNRGFVIYEDYLQIRSQYLTFYDLNNSYEHEDTNLVIGGYCFTTIPAQNATLDSITPIDRFQLFSWNGTVTVSTSSYTEKRMTLRVNSTDNATLLITVVDATRYSEYRVVIDGTPTGYAHSDSEGSFEYNYTGPWSNHTITFTYLGHASLVPEQWLTLIETFLILGLFLSVTRAMIWPLKSKKNISPQERTGVLIKAAIFIVVGTILITMVFNMFIGG